MSVTVKEVKRSRSLTTGQNKSARREYVAYGDVADPDDIELAVLGVAPLTASGLVRQSVTVTARDESEYVFDVTVDYGKREQQEPGETGSEEISFEIAPQTTRITQSKSTRWKQPVSAPDYKGGIGYKKDGFEGVDVFVESFSFSVTKFVPAAQVTNAYIAQLRDAAFKVNNASWRGFDEGEVLFLGAAGSKRDAESYSLTFRFSVSKNGTVDVGNGIPPVFKYGWDYVWVKYDKLADPRSQELIERPAAVYVEKVYDGADFETLLGLGA